MEKKPEWLKVKYNSLAVQPVDGVLAQLGLNTVCQSANCPNLGECYKKKTATFMVMGKTCTRTCGFCNIPCGRTETLDSNEPRNIAIATKYLKLKHVVVTQVTRDDLKDGGASHMAQTIKEIKRICKDVTVEVLISDLRGNIDALRVILEAKPDVLNHNVEMVKSLYKESRPQARYERSLKILEESKKIDPNILTKTGFMLGLGETDEEVYELMDDVLKTNCDILTISQYLRPSPKHKKVSRYVRLNQFDEYKRIAMEKGFKFVASGPLVRSSYQAAEAFEQAKKKEYK
ncbi:lipoyl synthase [Oceanivirga miroungae]|uniref:Lipoyl synthase n=1 Tax=Oceanivirga miroungae TaxID=1130046 RepID=A0A6I8MBG0_9FUSO|nr:lipoyl synthase [Oceanivirga miroungae]VWL85586.1 Lipoyl synthase [Oceanivirga miroungae]